jgi:hypothetical protein
VRDNDALAESDCEADTEADGLFEAATSKHGPPGRLSSERLVMRVVKAGVNAAAPESAGDTNCSTRA